MKAWGASRRVWACGLGGTVFFYGSVACGRSRCACSPVRIGRWPPKPVVVGSNPTRRVWRRSLGRCFARSRDLFSSWTAGSCFVDAYLGASLASSRRMVSGTRCLLSNPSGESEGRWSNEAWGRFLHLAASVSAALLRARAMVRLCPHLLSGTSRSATMPPCKCLDGGSPWPNWKLCLTVRTRGGKSEPIGMCCKRDSEGIQPERSIWRGFLWT